MFVLELIHILEPMIEELYIGAFWELYLLFIRVVGFWTWVASFEECDDFSRGRQDILPKVKKKPKESRTQCHIRFRIEEQK
jgi:hypothetical protein